MSLTTYVNRIPSAGFVPGRKIITTELTPFARLSTSIEEGKQRGQTILWIERHGGVEEIDRHCECWLSPAEHRLLAFEIIGTMERLGYDQSQSDWLRLVDADLQMIERTALTALTPGWSA
jgi:hypothetical protein